MRFIENEILERIGFDFYCDIANNIVKARAERDGLRRSWQSSQESNPIGWWELKM